MRARGAVHPREVDDHFSHGSVTNYWGGSSAATTHLLDKMHYRGVLRVMRRVGGIRIYAAHVHAPGPGSAAGRRAHIDALVDVVVGAYAPLPGASLAGLVSRLRYAVPQWTRELRHALERARARLAHERVEGVDWYWPAGERLPRGAPPTRRSLSGAVRPCGLGSPPLRAPLGLGVSLRGLHAGVSSAGSATTRCRSCGATV